MDPSVSLPTKPARIAPISAPDKLPDKYRSEIIACQQNPACLTAIHNRIIAEQNVYVAQAHAQAASTARSWGVTIFLLLLLGGVAYLLYLVIMFFVDIAPNAVTFFNNLFASL